MFRFKGKLRVYLYLSDTKAFINKTIENHVFQREQPKLDSKLFKENQVLNNTSVMAF